MGSSIQFGLSGHGLGLVQRHVHSDFSLKAFLTQNLDKESAFRAKVFTPKSLLH